MRHIELALRGRRPAAAEIPYHMPDHTPILQSFNRQEIDLAPKFPVFNKFLRFRETGIDGSCIRSTSPCAG